MVGWLVSFAFVFGGEGQRNRMVAIVGQMEQGKFLLLCWLVSAYIFCGNDVVKKKIDVQEKENTYRNE